MFLKLVPDTTSIPFTKFRMTAAAFSALLVIGSIFALFTVGLNFGVDFRGGVTIEVADDEPIDIGSVRDAMRPLNLGDVKVQETVDFAGGDPAVVIFIEQQAARNDAGDEAAPAEITDNDEIRAGEVAQQDALVAAKDALKALLGDDAQFRKTDVVGPVVSGELIEKGVTAVVISLFFMLIYIWAQFEWQFSVGAIAALAHDVIITLGMFTVTQLEFKLEIIAAILTIVGYSMNDTVVVYDRVRENLRKFKKKDLTEVIDISINETLSRTIMTSVTTLLALGSLYVFGGEVLRGFTFAMIWGVVIGTYSSIFVASPILMATGVKRDWSKAAAEQQPATP
ncbi:MAG: protein translocase subunit SecF [Pseudomonadota bacterium]